jgi:hypothetical protein
MTAKVTPFCCPHCGAYHWPREIWHLDILPRFIYGVDIRTHPSNLFCDWGGDIIEWGTKYYATPREMIEGDLYGT